MYATGKNPNLGQPPLRKFAPTVPDIHSLVLYKNRGTFRLSPHSPRILQTYSQTCLLSIRSVAFWDTSPACPLFPLRSHDLAGGLPFYGCFFPFPFRNCGCPALAFFARAGMMQRTARDFWDESLGIASILPAASYPSFANCAKSGAPTDCGYVGIVKGRATRPKVKSKRREVECSARDDKIHFGIPEDVLISLRIPLTGANRRICRSSDP